MPRSLFSAAAAAAPQKIDSWPDGAPGAALAAAKKPCASASRATTWSSNVHRPSHHRLSTEKQRTGHVRHRGAGGGHRELWTDHEGHNVARFLNERGIAAFVLQYRLARAPNSTYTIEGDALNDLKRAIRTVRSRAEWKADTRQVGVMGFSAGGQLAALAATRGDAGDASAPDADRSGFVEARFRRAGLPGHVADARRSTANAAHVAAVRQR